jgi:hypothetical protein
LLQSTDNALKEKLGRRARASAISSLGDSQSFTKGVVELGHY